LSLLLQVVFAGLATPSASAATRLAALIDSSLCASDGTAALPGSKAPGAQSGGCCKAACPMLAGGLTAALSPVLAGPATYASTADVTASIPRAGAPHGGIVPDATGPPASA
jgi:hypothetical protein